jgi:uncharacterized protein YggE
MRPIALSLALALVAGVSFAQEQRPPVIVTVGTAILQRAPDVAFVSLGVEARARTPREAQQQIATAMNAVSRKLTELSIPDDARRTIGIRIEPDYEFTNGRRVPRGYVAHNSLEVRVDDIARAGELADAAVQAGATSIEGIRFDLKDRAAVEREAIRLAVADARRRADAAAAGAGVTIDRIIRIEEGERPQMPRPVMMSMARVGADAAEKTTVDPGLIDVRAQVTLTASMK